MDYNCKYCGSIMELDDKEFDRQRKCVGKWYLCKCGGALYMKNVHGFWVRNWTKEGEE